MAFLSLHASGTHTKVSLQLHWKYQFEFAGFIAAKEKGFYEDVGLDVTLKEYEFGMNIEDEVINGTSTYGIYNSNILLSYLDNKPIKLLGSFFKRSALVIITKPEIKTLEHLVGKNVMAGTQEDFNFNFKYMFDKEHVDIQKVKLVKHTYRIDEFVAGKVDAMTVFISDLPHQLDNMNVPYNILNPSDYGIYNLQLELFTSKYESVFHFERAEAFRKASIRGWEYALAHKEELIDIIYEKYSQRLSKKSLSYEAKITERLILPNIYAIGSIDKPYIKRQLEVFRDEYKLKEIKALDDFLFSNIKIKKEFILSKEEQQYFKEKEEIKLCIDPDWMPFERLNKEKKHQGMTAEYFEYFRQFIPIPIHVVKTHNWSESLDYMKNGKCDILSLTMATESRKKYFNFTAPYIDLPLVLATQIDKPFIAI